MTTFKERLNAALVTRGLSAADLSRMTGINEGALSQYRKGAYEASQRNLEKLARALNVSIPWLMGFDVPAVPELPSPTITDDVVSFPILAGVAAGYNRLAVPDAEAEKIDIPRQYLRGRPETDYFALRVVGSSMYPLYQDGDVVLVLRQATMNRSGEIGVVIYDDEAATLKKVEYVMGEDWMRLVPINPAFEPVLVTDEKLEHCRVLGIPRLLIREVKQ